MAVSRLPDKLDIPSLDLAELPRWKFNDREDVSQQIATHLRKALEELGAGNPPSLRTPSVMHLADFCNRSILDVLDALYALKLQHYEYVMNGLDADVILHDPLARKRGSRRTPGWSGLADAASNPWNALHQVGRKPLSEIFPRKVV